MGTTVPCKATVGEIVTSVVAFAAGGVHSASLGPLLINGEGGKGMKKMEEQVDKRKGLENGREERKKEKGHDTTSYDSHDIMKSKGPFIATQLNSTRRRVVDTFTA